MTAKKYYKVTISGLICTGKTSLFWGLFLELGWSVFSASQFFRDFARSHKISLEKAQEQGPVLTKKVDGNMRSLLINTKNIIIEGWMAGIMAHGLPGVLRVLLKCNNGVRVERFAQRDNISLTAARKKIASREKNLFDQLEKIYQRHDFIDPENYDLVIDTTHKTDRELINLVVKKLAE